MINIGHKGIKQLGDYKKTYSKSDEKGNNSGKIKKLPYLQEAYELKNTLAGGNTDNHTLIVRQRRDILNNFITQIQRDINDGKFNKTTTTDSLIITLNAVNTVKVNSDNVQAFVEAASVLAKHATTSNTKTNWFGVTNETSNIELLKHGKDCKSYLGEMKNQGYLLRTSESIAKSYLCKKSALKHVSDDPMLEEEKADEQSASKTLPIGFRYNINHNSYECPVAIIASKQFYEELISPSNSIIPSSYKFGVELVHDNPLPKDNERPLIGEYSGGNSLGGSPFASADGKYFLYVPGTSIMENDRKNNYFSSMHAHGAVEFDALQYAPLELFDKDYKKTTIEEFKKQSGISDLKLNQFFYWLALKAQLRPDDKYEIYQIEDENGGVSSLKVTIRRNIKPEERAELLTEQQKALFAEYGTVNNESDALNLFWHAHQHHTKFELFNLAYSVINQFFNNNYSGESRYKDGDKNFAEVWERYKYQFTTREQLLVLIGICSQLSGNHYLAKIPGSGNPHPFIYEVLEVLQSYNSSADIIQTHEGINTLVVPSGKYICVNQVGGNVLKEILGV